MRPYYTANPPFSHYRSHRTTSPTGGQSRPPANSLTLKKYLQMALAISTSTGKRIATIYTTSILTSTAMPNIKRSPLQNTEISGASTGSYTLDSGSPLAKNFVPQTGAPKVKWVRTYTSNRTNLVQGTLHYCTLTNSPSRTNAPLAALSR